MTRDVSSESDQVLWMPVREVIRQVDDGRLAMLPPTYATCLELFEPTDVAAALAAARPRTAPRSSPRCRSTAMADTCVSPTGWWLSETRCSGRWPVHDCGRAGARGWVGGSFGSRATCVLAPNAGIMTLDGTNTWVLKESDAARAVVIDPGRWTPRTWTGSRAPPVVWD